MFRAFTACLLVSTVPCFSTPLIVAHRGASHDAPENTLPAFKLAWKQGADAIEGDFHLTSDGKIVCIHDYDTKRVAGQKLVVKQTSLKDLRELDAGAWLAPKWKGTKVPTFKEVAATVPATGKFYIEVKCGPEIVPQLLREIAATGLKPEQVVVISFDASVIREVKDKAPNYKACWLSSFEKKSPLDPSVDQAISTMREIKADGFSSKADLRLNEEYIKVLNEAGFEYHCWTVNDPKVAKQFEELGALSITTDRPGYIRESIEP